MSEAEQAAEKLIREIDPERPEDRLELEKAQYEGYQRLARLRAEARALYLRAFGQNAPSKKAA